MKKLLLLSAILIGAATASQAGLSFNIGFSLPTPRGVVISRPAPVCEPSVVINSAPAYYAPAPACEEPAAVAPPVCEPAPVVVTSPVYAPRVVVAARPLVVERRVVASYRHDDRNYSRADRDYGHDDHAQWNLRARSHR